MIEVVIAILIFTIATCSGVIIQCTYISQLEFNEYRYGCNAVVASFSNPSSIDHINGTHISTNTNNEVQFFVIDPYRHELFTIPKNIEKFFPNLVVFRWFNGHLSAISADDFKPFQKLASLSLTRNNLDTLDGNLFEYSEKLQVIDFSDNPLQHVGYDLFATLGWLERANFTLCDCIDYDALNREEVLQLNDMIPVKCPPLETTTYTTTSTKDPGSECSFRCSLNQETSDLKRQVDDHEGRICDLENQLNDLRARMVQP